MRGNVGVRSQNRLQSEPRALRQAPFDSPRLPSTALGTGRSGQAGQVAQGRQGQARLGMKPILAAGSRFHLSVSWPVLPPNGALRFSRQLRNYRESFLVAGICLQQNGAGGARLKKQRDQMPIWGLNSAARPRPGRMRGRGCEKNIIFPNEANNPFGINKSSL